MLSLGPTVHHTHHNFIKISWFVLTLGICTTECRIIITVIIVIIIIIIKLLSTHIFCPVAVEETTGTWNGLVIELVQIGRRITAITEDTRETVFLFQRLSMALQQRNAVAFQNTMSTEWVAVAAVNTFL